MRNIVKEKIVGFTQVMATEHPIVASIVDWKDGEFTVEAYCDGSDYGCQDFDSLESAEDYYESFEELMAA